MSELRKAAIRSLHKLNVRMLLAVKDNGLDDIQRRRLINDMKRRKTDLKAALEEYESSTAHQIAAQSLLLSMLEKENGR